MKLLFKHTQTSHWNFERSTRNTTWIFLVEFQFTVNLSISSTLYYDEFLCLWILSNNIP